MINIVISTNVEKEFNILVENIKAIFREARHMPISGKFERESKQFMKFMDDVNFNEAFKDEPEDYIYAKMLDAMDYILDNWVKEYKDNDYIVANSVYDAIREFYFA